MLEAKFSLTSIIYSFLKYLSCLIITNKKISLKYPWQSVSASQPASQTASQPASQPGRQAGRQADQHKSHKNATATTKSEAFQNHVNHQ